MRIYRVSEYSERETGYHFVPWNGMQMSYSQYDEIEYLVAAKSEREARAALTLRNGRFATLKFMGFAASVEAWESMCADDAARRKTEMAAEEAERLVRAEDHFRAVIGVDVERPGSIIANGSGYTIMSMGGVKYSRYLRSVPGVKSDAIARAFATFERTHVR